MSLKARQSGAKALAANPAEAQQPRGDFDSLLAQWVPLTFALNSLNRGMGLPDLDPSVLASMAVGKLQLVHEVIAGSKSSVR